MSKPHEYISDTRVWSLLWDGNKEGHWFSYLTRRMNLVNLVDAAKNLCICRLTVSRLRAWRSQLIRTKFRNQTYIMYGLVRSLADKNLINCSSNAFANFVSSKLVIPMSSGISSAVISAATVTRKVYKVLVTWNIPLWNLYQKSDQNSSFHCGKLKLSDTFPLFIAHSSTICVTILWG